MAENFDNEVKESIASNNIGETYKDIEKQLKENPNTRKEDSATATTALQDKGLLPGITIDGLDETNDASGTGLTITDTHGSNGKTETYTLDTKTGVAKDSDGNVQAIFYPNGTVQRFEYEPGSKPPVLKQVTDASGNTWNKNGDKWEGKDKDGKPITSDASFDVDQTTGKITIKNGSTGTSEEHFTDGSAVYRDKNGRVTDVMYAFNPNDGNQRTARHFDFDEATGELKGVTVSYPDDKGQPPRAPQQWTHNADGTWSADIDGKKVTSNAQFTVDRQTGAVTIKNKDGTEEKYARDGKSTIKMANGTEVQRDAGGHPTRIKYAGGRTLDIEWDNGQISRIKQQGGVDYLRGADGKWTDPEGNPVDVNNVIVHPSGDVELVGSTASTMMKVDGTEVKFDDKGRPTAVKDKSGKIVRSYEYDNEGLKSYTLNGKKYERVDKDTWLCDDGNGVSRVKQEVQIDLQGNLSITRDGVATYYFTDGSHKQAKVSSHPNSSRSEK